MTNCSTPLFHSVIAQVTRSKVSDTWFITTSIVMLQQFIIDNISCSQAQDSPTKHPKQYTTRAHKQHQNCTSVPCGHVRFDIVVFLLTACLYYTNFMFLSFCNSPICFVFSQSMWKAWIFCHAKMFLKTQLIHILSPKISYTCLVYLQLIIYIKIPYNLEDMIV